MCETGPLLWRLIRIRIRITWEPQPLLAHLNFTLATNGNFSSLFGVIIMKSESFSVVAAAVCCSAALPPTPLCMAFKIGFAALCHCRRRRRRIAAGRSVQRCCYSNPFGIWSIRLSCCCLQSLSLPFCHCHQHHSVSRRFDCEKSNSTDRRTRWNVE